MIKASQLREAAQSILAGQGDRVVLQAVETAANRLLTGMGAGNIVCRLHSWDDSLPFATGRAVLDMVRALELRRTDFEEEAGNYERLAMRHARE